MKSNGFNNINIRLTNSPSKKIPDENQVFFLSIADYFSIEHCLLVCHLSVRKTR